MIYQLIVFLPLVGFAIAGMFGRRIGDTPSQWITSILVSVSALLSVLAWWNVAGHGDHFETVHLATWMQSGDLAVDWALKIDTLTVIMLVVVNGVSALVHWYSMGYMAEDPDKPRFFAYLSLFTFAMLMLVTADNLVQMFFGWEGVGLASYLLIGFWFKKASANNAAMKAFIVNRVGDFGFSLGIFAAFVLFGSVQFDVMFANVDAVKDARFEFLGYSVPALTTTCLLLFVGAMGKSAQLFLHTWLPDAMEGPTPVSALIHAATMVTAGVFLVARCSPLFEAAPDSLYVVTLVGAATAFFAATIGLVQNDIKRVIAYSTCSQLGYMFAALGVGAYGGAIFHLFTHAFFKALLFLGAGSVIHAMHHEQDMRRMGALWRKIPTTYAMMLIGTLALTGVGVPGLVGFAGFYSKDIIIESIVASHAPGYIFAAIMTVAAALMTSFYSWRLVFMTFHGKARGDQSVHDHAHESPPVMLIPLGILALGALFAGLLFHEVFVGHDRLHFWEGALVTVDGDVLDEAHHVSKIIKWLPTLMMTSGLLMAILAYILRPGMSSAIAGSARGLYDFLLNKWYFDELYDWIIVRPAKFLGGFLWVRGDQRIIDGLGPDGVAQRVLDTGQRTQSVQSGYLYHYAFAMLIGVVGAIAYLLIVMNGGL